MASFSEIDLILAGEELNSLIPKEPLPSKVDRLQTRKQEKINLPTVASHGHLMNSLSAEELQAELSHVVGQRLYSDDKGGYYQQRQKDNPDGSWEFEKVAFTDKNKWGQLDTRNLYIDNTEDGNFKLGIARTDQGGYEGRYNPDLHPERNMGNRGVTTEDGAFLDIILPNAVATRFEHLIHMNQGQIRNRVIGTGPITQQHRDNFGSGMTEYTTPNAPLWNINHNPKDDFNELENTTLLPTDIKVSAPFPEIIGGPFMEALKQRESSGNYKAINEYGFLGAYQMGAAVLSDLGYVKKGSRNNDLNNPDTWTGKNGINSLDAFLLNPAIQDRAAQKHIGNLTRQLRGSAKNQRDLNGKIFAAWLLGVRGSKNLNATDANGTTGQEYYDIGAGILAPTPEPVNVPGPNAINTALAFFAGGTKIGIGTADWIVEGVGEALAKAGFEAAKDWDIATEAEKTAIANSLVNYDDRRTRHNIEEIRKLYDLVTENVELDDPKTWKNLAKGDNLRKIGKMFQTAFQTPEQALYSLGYMLPALFDPSKKTKVGSKIVKTLNNDKLTTTAKKAKIDAIKEEASASDIAKYLAAKKAGVAVIASDMTNNQLDEWIANNKGEDPEMLDVARIFAINFGLLIPDVAVTKFALNPKSLNAALRALPDKKLHRFIQHSALTVTRLTAAGMGELAQEYAQTLGEVFNTKYDSEKYEGMTATE
ncbi:MAG: hypothetical protein LR001_10480, partial [Clostridiales bacterium]|nr:hypothetical protein [Clostridiales bacterium]